MEKKLKSEVTSEISFSAIVDSTSNLLHLNEIKKEFSLSKLHSYGGLVLDHGVGSIHPDTNLKLKIDNAVKPEVTNDMSLAVIVDSTLHDSHLNEIKKEFSLPEPHSYGGFAEQAVVKQENSSIQSLDLQIKSEVPDLKCGTVSGNEDIYKFEPLVCEELHIKNELEESLIEQTIKTSTQVKHFHCSLCNKKFEFKKYLQRHMIAHTREKPFQCNICDYTCKRKYDLNQHIKVHIGEKPFKCTVCEFRSIRKRDLKQHIKLHTGEKPYQCNLCDYKCIRQRVLQQHMKAHTGEKPFKCNMCDYTCIQNATLQTHMKNHTGDKPFQCSMCDYKCLWKCNLQKHMKTHTGEKPFQCHVCDYKCIQKNHLQRHIKTHTGKKTVSV